MERLPAGKDPRGFAVPSVRLKVAATYSISGAVVGEWIGAQEGLGYYLLRVKNGYMLDKVFACVAVIIGLSLCMNGAVRLLGRLWLPYERKHKRTADTAAGWTMRHPAGCKCIRRSQETFIKEENVL